MELEQKIGRGIRAKEVLENEIYIESYAALTKEIIELWQQSPARDVEGREKLFLMIGLIDKLKAIIQTEFETGVLAEASLNRKRTLLEQARDALMRN